MISFRFGFDALPLRLLREALLVRDFDLDFDLDLDLDRDIDRDFDRLRDIDLRRDFDFDLERLRRRALFFSSDRLRAAGDLVGIVCAS